MDTGMKFAKSGEDIDSTGVGDYFLWTKYPPLTFLEKKSVNITVSTEQQNTIETVNHSWGFFPFVRGTVQDQSDGDRYWMDSENFAELSCDTGDSYISQVRFNYKVYTTKVDIFYDAYCYQPFMGGLTDDPVSSSTFNIDLYFYMWELGSKWPL